eukprot:84529_1
MTSTYTSFLLLILLINVSVSGIIKPDQNVFDKQIGAQSGMYGLSGASYKDGRATLVEYNVVNGTTTSLATPIGLTWPLTGESLGCLDNIHGVYFFIFEENSADNGALIMGLYPYNLVDPTKNFKPIMLPMIFADPEIVGSGDQCVSDPNTGDIYVFGHDAIDQNYQLLLRVQFDPKLDQAMITQIGNYSQINDTPLLPGKISIYDSKRNMMWFAGEYGADKNNYTVNYFYINSTNGELVNTISWFPTIETAAYSPRLDKIVGFKQNGQAIDGSYVWQFMYADPVTFEITKTFQNISNHYCAWNPIWSIDTKGGVFYTMLFKLPDETAPCTSYNGTFYGHLIGINVDNGEVVSQPEYCQFGSIETCPYDIQYWNMQSIY